MTTYIPPELSARISALESLVFHLYQELNIPMPSPRESVADTLPPEIQELAKTGSREQAIRRALVVLGISLQDAQLRVDGYLKAIGR
ncbi:MAG: hypothetical protein ACK5LO_16215 [Leucobacter sp.]